MSTGSLLKCFLKSAQKDSRIKPTHISLFMALWLGGKPDRSAQALTIYRKDIMPLARIASIATYHKCMKELVAYGYIIYQPSYNYYAGSKVILTVLEDISRIDG